MEDRDESQIEAVVEEARPPAVEGMEGDKGISIFTPSGLSVRQEEERKAEMAALMKGVKEHKAYVRKMIYEGMGGWRGIMTDLMRKDNEQIRLNWALREFSTLSEDKGAANIQTNIQVNIEDFKKKALSEMGIKEDEQG